MTVMAGNNALATLSFDTRGRTRSNMGWVYHEYTIVAEATRTRITFKSEVTERAFGPALDDVSLRQLTP